MTYEEAHAYLEDLQREFTTHRRAYADNLIEANGAAILALEKQIPKKPIKIYSHYLCPNCRSIKTSCAPFCRMCGQALDWSDGKCTEMFPCGEFEKKEKEGNKNE